MGAHVVVWQDFQPAPEVDGDVVPGGNLVRHLVVGAVEVGGDVGIGSREAIRAGVGREARAIGFERARCSSAKLASSFSRKGMWAASGPSGPLIVRTPKPRARAKARFFSRGS
jgi:hypothetical protein